MTFVYTGDVMVALTKFDDRCPVKSKYLSGQDMADDFKHLFANIRDFGWNPAKRESNLVDHKIDFDNVRTIFDGYTFIRRSDRHGEVRYQVFGYIQGQEIAVACAVRGSLCWVISAWRARRDERRKYYYRFERRPDQRQD